MKTESSTNSPTATSGPVVHQWRSLIVGVHLLLRITTTGIAVIVPQNPKRARLLPQEPSAMQLIIRIIGCRISRTMAFVL